MDKRPVDWEAVEREYRAGQLSVREIGKSAGVSHVAILKRAKRDGWTQNLAARVREEVTARLVTAEVTAATSRETVDQAATRVVEIVRSHRKDISTGRGVVRALFDELIEGTENRDAIEEEIERETEEDQSTRRKAMMMRAVALPQRAATAASLATALKTIVGLERQAFGIDGADEEAPATKGDIRSALAKLSNGQRDQLRGIAEAISREPGGTDQGA